MVVPFQLSVHAEGDPEDSTCPVVTTLRRTPPVNLLQPRSPESVEVAVDPLPQPPKLLDQLRQRAPEFGRAEAMAESFVTSSRLGECAACRLAGR